MYKLTESGKFIVRIDDNAFIPISEANSDYREYLNWLAQGNIVEAADVAKQPVLSVSQWQIREAMNQLGLRVEVEGAIAAGDQSLKDLWNYAPAFSRDHPKIAEIATAIGKTEADIDGLFTLAASLSL